MTLLVYDADSLPRTFKARLIDGKALFSGSVNGITYAELRHKTLRGAVPLFIENSNISVTINPDNPEASSVTGSRSNSLFRYQLEQCSESENRQCLEQFVADNPTSPFAAYIIRRFLVSDPDAAASLFEKLSGEATTTWHYRQLKQQMKSLLSLKPGNRMESFSFCDKHGKTVALDSLIADSNNHLIMFSASWCDKCDEADRIAQKDYPNLKRIRIDFDNEKKGWDAPYMKQFAIEHIPYLILLDANGTILANDLRVWELKKYIKPKK